MTNVYEIVEKSRKSGKIEKGANEATKAAERGTAKLIVYASDVDPKQIVAHLPIICNEKNIFCVEADSKKKLGLAAGINVGCAAVAVIMPGDAEKDLAAFKTTSAKK
jgi:large subunit ribosomal protein L7Ae